MISKRELRAININVDPLMQDKCSKKIEVQLLKHRINYLSM